jgi:hypothetical protein
MNKQMENHVFLLAKLKSILIQCGIKNDKTNKVNFEIPAKTTKCHLGINGLENQTIYIKTAYAESFSSNQALRYPAQVKKLANDKTIWFVFDGLGFNHNRYKECKSDIRGIIGVEQVMSVEQFRQRIIKLAKKEKAPQSDN